MSVFISYRRADSQKEAELLYSELTKRIDPTFVFMDVASIEGGENFEEKIKEEIKNSPYVLVIIGPKWLEILQQRAKETDYVYLEIKYALGLNRRVIPILLEDTPMPTAKDLPNKLRSLALRNALRLRRQYFNGDMNVILKIIDLIVRYSKINDIVAKLVFAAVIIGFLSLAFPPLFALASVIGFIACFIIGPIGILMTININILLKGNAKI